MRTAILKFLKMIVRLFPSSLLPYIVRRNIFSVFYHAVSDGPMDHVRHLYPIVSVSKFKDALTYLQQKFSFISYDQLDDHVINGKELPHKAVHLSFDDGFVECYTVVRPILLERKIPCTFFLTTDWLDNQMLYYRHQVSLCVQKSMDLSVGGQTAFIHQVNKQLDQDFQTNKEFVAWITRVRDPENTVFGEINQLLEIDPQDFLINDQPYLTTDQVRQMHADGFTIGAHSLSHKKLITASKEEIELEIVESCWKIQDITGQERVPFSFPQSAWGVNRELLTEIRKRNSFVGLLFDTKDLRKDVSFMINRIWAERSLTTDRHLSTIPDVFTQAYRDAWVDEIMVKLKR